MAYTTRIADSIAEQLRNLFKNIDTIDGETYHDVISKGYDVINSDEFRVIYNELTEEMCERLGMERSLTVAQVKPAFRYHKCGERSVPFHIDRWSGHPQEIVNVWFGIKGVNENTGLYFVDQEASTQLISDLENGLLDLTGFDSKCLEQANVLLPKADEVIVFGNENIHGTLRNTGNEPRFSIDFRMCYRDQLEGTKLLGEDYRYIVPDGSPKIAARRCHSIVYMANRMKHVSHKTQRYMVLDYCKRHDLEIVSENSELQGCQGVPQIQQLLESTEDMVVVPSKRCLSKEQLEILNLLKRSERDRLVFALECEGI